MGEYFRRDDDERHTHGVFEVSLVLTSCAKLMGVEAIDWGRGVASLGLHANFANHRFDAHCLSILRAMIISTGKTKARHGSFAISTQLYYTIQTGA